MTVVCAMRSLWQVLKTLYRVLVKGEVPPELEEPAAFGKQERQ